jgi:hypothetical protein
MESGFISGKTKGKTLAKNSAIHGSCNSLHEMKLLSLPKYEHVKPHYVMLHFWSESVPANNPMNMSRKYKNEAD